MFSIMAQNCQRGSQNFKKKNWRQLVANWSNQFKILLETRKSKLFVAFWAEKIANNNTQSSHFFEECSRRPILLPYIWSKHTSVKCLQFRKHPLGQKKIVHHSIHISVTKNRIAKNVALPEAGKHHQFWTVGSLFNNMLLWPPVSVQGVPHNVTAVDMTADMEVGFVRHQKCHLFIIFKIEEPSAKGCPPCGISWFQLVAPHYLWETIL